MNKGDLEIRPVYMSFNCDKIAWMNWNRISTFDFEGRSNAQIATLKLDTKSGVINPLLNSFRLETNVFIPKQISNMPTPWMPGNPSIKILNHRLYLNSVSNPEDLILLLGSFPNANFFVNKLPGRLKAFDSNNVQLDITNVEILLQDPIEGNILLPTTIKNKGTEITFEVLQGGTTHGDIILLHNFPKNTSYFEIEHYNEFSRSDDGIFINVGFPDCCYSTANKIDTSVCNQLTINGITYFTSGSYADTLKTNNCDSIINYNLTILNTPILELGKDTIICNGESLTLSSNSISTVWSDGTTGKEITVNKAGVYWAELTNICGTIRDSIILNIQSKPNLELGSNLQICPNAVDTIWSNDPNTIWQDGSVGPFFIIKKDGIVKATIKSICGDVTDSIAVSYYSNILFSLLKDTVLCSGEIFKLNSPFDSTTWSDGTIGKNLTVNKAGLYWAEVKSQCLTVRDSILITYQLKPNLELGSDFQICPNAVDTIWSNDPNTIWQDGSVGPFFIIKKDGIVKATIKSICGDVTDSIAVSYYSNILFSLPKDTVLCSGEIFKLNSPFDSTTWSDGTIGKNLTVNKAGLYWAEVKSQCLTVRDSILITYQLKPNLELGPDLQICPNAIDTIWSNDPNTIWQDGSVGPFFIIKKDGKILATITNICGVISDSILVSYYVNSNIALGPDTSICEGSLLTLNSSSNATVWFDNTIGSSKQISKGGKYWASIISPCGIISDSIEISEMKVYQKPYLPNDTFVCQGINLNLSIPIIDELWNNQFLNMINIQSPGKYWYSFRDICNNLTDTIEVFYDSIPMKFPKDNLVFCGSEVYHFFTGNYKTQWSDGTIGSEISISKSGIYHYSISNSCGNFNDSIHLEFIEDVNSYLPNVFSPNGDQINDVFPGPQFTADFEIEIYDRWGSQVFKSSNIHWNGTFKDQNVPSGVYAYVIRSKACSNQLKYGNVTVVR